MSKNQGSKSQGIPTTYSRPEIRSTPGSRQPGTSSGSSITSIKPPKK
ncbi:hypothetical protein [Clostridium butyricum]